MSKFILSKTPFLLSLYLITILGFCFFIQPTHDSFYYWQWSRNLHLSYYDGPPLIAYTLRLMTIFFGNNFFAINILGWIISMLSILLIYQIGKLLAGRKLGLLSALLWLVYPFITTRYLLLNITYDSLENLFYLTTIFFMFRFIKTEARSNLYYLGISIGLLLLAKYTGIILILGLLMFCLLNKNGRKIFAGKEIYFAVVITILIFSPVLIWNYQNQFSSFYYQLHSHSWNGANGTINSKANFGLKGIWFYFGKSLLGTYHILLLLGIVFYIKNKQQLNFKNPMWQLLLVILITFILFWLPISYSSHVAPNYMLPINSIVCLIIGYILLEAQAYKTTLFFTSIFTLISIAMLFGRSVPLHKQLAIFNTQANQAQYNYTQTD